MIPLLGAQRSKHHTGVCFSGMHHISIPYRTDAQAKNAEKQASNWCSEGLRRIRHGGLSLNDTPSWGPREANITLVFASLGCIVS